MVRLQPDHPSAAYQCGRLLAVLEQVQRGAIPGITSTIVTRFYGTASCAPNVVFSQLLRGAQPHLAKLERDRPGAAYALNQKLEAILRHASVTRKLSCFPRTLNLTEQGLFALGYYHQRAHNRAQARKNAQKKKEKEKEKSNEPVS